MILSNGKKYQPQGYKCVVDFSTGETFAVSNATGEVTAAITVTVPVGTTFITPEQQAEINEKKAKLEEFYDQKMRLDALGQFAFVNATQEFEDVSPETAARLIYLSTFLKWQSGALFLTQRRPMCRRDLPEVMGLSHQTVSRFLKEATPKYIFIDSANNVYMNPDYFVRGKIGRHGESMSWRKIYIGSVRKLYRLAGKSKHRYLGYVFQMLPYINLEYNVLCTNCFEKDLELVDFMTDRDFCDKIDYDYSSVSRLKKVYRDIRFDVEGHTEPFCAFVDVGDRTRIYVNPHILYNGTRPDMVTVLGSFCNGT